MFRPRTFRGRMFLSILVVALVPAAVALLGGVFALREMGSTTGTLGPWDAVAGSGERLVEEALRAAPGDSAVQTAARAHRSALSESLRRSRLWSYVAERFVEVLPAAAALAVLAVGLLSFAAAALLSRSFSRPVRELVGWTERIARSEPLPSPAEREHETVELARLRDALRTMAGELREARVREVEAARLRAWTDMARRVAHELKNPLTPMRLAARALAGSEDPRAADEVEVLLDEIGRLDEMARTFSQFGRMPEGPRSEVDLAEMLRSLAAAHGDGAVTVSVQEDGAPVPTITAHHDVLERVFRNLLVNAVEASGSGEGGPVEVTLDRHGDRARVRIRDHGAGIPEEILDSVWMPDVTTKRRGTGLGLAIVRQGVDAHDGEARARNVPEGGAEFEVTLPLRRPAG